MNKLLCGKGFAEVNAQEVLALIPIEKYTMDVARVCAHVRREKDRGAYDPLIETTAAATARTVIMIDASTAFGESTCRRVSGLPR